MENIAPYEELIAAQEEYIKMLGEELDEIAILSYIHGWRSSRFEIGEKMRERIENAKESIKNTKNEKINIKTD